MNIDCMTKLKDTQKTSLKHVTVQIASVKALKEEKIRKWENTLPMLQLSDKQKKSIEKGLQEAKQRKGHVYGR